MNKAKLLELRAEFTPHGRRWRWRCACCGTTAREVDIHHWLFRRMPVPDEVLWDERNLVTVHHRCHVPEHPDFQHRVAQSMFRLYGRDTYERWIEELLVQGIVRHRPDLPPEEKS